MIRYVCGIFLSLLGRNLGFISPSGFSFIARANMDARGKRADSRKWWRDGELGKAGTDSISKAALKSQGGAKAPPCDKDCKIEKTGEGVLFDKF